ncbi:MAG: hypothetical protein RBS81_00710 [Tenuifilaceae bacterium]|jgi:exopolyphosphatase/guanosine-5'-triphosphate,3'-diphosphate pyrophosphatase|nr:hypothetical protein [Tenuifilaceae bacterium]
MNIAIIDLGTNTFNLLVAETKGNGSYEIIHSGKLGVKLGEGGINRKLITAEAQTRGLDAIAKHMETAASFEAERVFAFATSATRNAANGKEFVQEIYNRFGLQVNVIDGSQEAELIYYGVRQAFPLGEEKSLILDIGGGSNELIIADANKHYWLKSFDLGISRLLQLFNPSDPITIEEISHVEDYLENALQPLFKACELYKPTRLVGSSGSFDTYRSILAQRGKINVNGQVSVYLPFDCYLELHRELVHSTKEQRTRIPGLEPLRVEMIVLATIFTRFILKRTGIHQMHQSTYALKEGAIWKMIHHNGFSN